jgi:hypothetical protein
MDKHHLHWFTVEIETHTSAALSAYKLIEKMLANKNSMQSREVWFLAQSFLTHTAMVSKMFAPSRKEQQYRGSLLREHLSIQDHSPILPRDARDNLEHIDERVNRWVKDRKNGFVEMVFYDRIGFNYICQPDTAVSRALIADEMVFITEDKVGKRAETSLKTIAKNLEILLKSCRHKLQTESPYQYLLAQALRNYQP